MGAGRGGGESLRDMRYSAMGIKAMTRNMYSMALTIAIVYNTTVYNDGDVKKYFVCRT